LAEEVEITNVGGADGVASEATLVSLANSMRRLAEQRGLDPRSTESKLIDTSNKARKSSIEVIRENRKRLEEQTEEIKESTKSIGILSKSFGVVTAGIGGLTSIVGSFAKELLLGGDRLSDFSQHVPLVGSILTPFVKYLENSLDAFRDLSVVGASFGNSMIDLRRAALEASMPLDEFTDLVRNNSTVMAALGGNTSSGAIEFARLSKELRTGVGADLMGMGFTITELNEALVNYSDFTNRQIGVDRLNNRNLVQGTAEYLFELDKLARLTGLSRKQLQEQINANQADARIRFARSRMTDKQQLQFDSNLTLAASKSQAFSNILADMVDGRPDEELSRGLFSLSSVFRENAENIKDMDTAEFLKFSNDLTAEIERLGVGFEEAGVLEAMLRDGVFADMFGLQNDLSDLRRLTAADIENARVEQLKRDRITSELAQFEESIRNIRTNIQVQLINSGIFNTLSASIASVASLINSPEGMAAIKNAIEDVTAFFNNFAADVADQGLWNAIKNAFMDGFSSLWKEAKLFLFGGVRDYTEEIENTQNRLNNLNAQRNAMVTRGVYSENNLEGYRTEELATLEAQIDRLRRGRDRMMSDQGQTVQGVFEGIGEDIFGLDDEVVRNITQERMALMAELDALTVKSQYSGLTEDEAARMDALPAMIAELTQQLEGSEGIIGSLLGDIDGTTLAIGTAAGVGLIGALALLGIGLGSVALPIAAVAAAIGLGAAGLGYLVKELGTLVKNLEPIFDSAFKAIETTVTTIGTTITNSINGIFDGITDVINALSNYKTAATTAETTQISELSTLDAANIDLVATAVSNLKTALENYPTPSALDTLLSFATGGANIELMSAVTTQISELSTLDAANIDLVATAVSNLKTALENYPTPGVFTTLLSFATEGADTNLMNNITNQITTLATALSPLDGEKLSSASAGISAMGNALIDFAKGLAAQSAAGILESIAGWFSFGEDEQNIVDKIIDFGNAFSQLNSAGIIQGADGMTSLANSIAALNNAGISDLSFDRNVLENLRALSNMGLTLEKTATSLTTIAGLTGLDTNLQFLAGFTYDTEGIRSYTEAIDDLVDQLEDLNDVLEETVVNRGRGRQTLTTADVLGNIDTASQTTASSIQGLNTTMQQILTILTQTKEIETRIERNTSSLGNNVASGRVSHIR
jgi:hypothetical protein